MNKEQLIELGLSEEQADKVMEIQQKDNSITQEQFNKMTYNERVELYQNSPEIFNKLTQ